MISVVITFDSQLDADQFRRDEIAEQYGATTAFVEPRGPSLEELIDHFESVEKDKGLSTSGIAAGVTAKTLRSFARDRLA